MSQCLSAPRLLQPSLTLSLPPHILCQSARLDIDSSSTRQEAGKSRKRRESRAQEGSREANIEIVPLSRAHGCIAGKPEREDSAALPDTFDAVHTYAGAHFAPRNNSLDFQHPHKSVFIWGVSTLFMTMRRGARGLSGLRNDFF